MSRTRIDSAHLACFPLFHRLGDATLDTILAASRSLFVAPRHVITSAGEPAPAVLVVLSGRVQLATEDQTGVRSTLGVLGPGTVIGDAALLDPGGYAIEAGAFAVTATALEDVLYLAIDAGVFRDLMATDARFAGNVARVLARRLRMMVVRDAWLATLELPARLARFIAWLADNEAGRAGNTETELTLRISQEKLGELVGATRESVNKHLRDWARNGIAEHVGGRIRIRNLAGLHALAARSLELVPIRDNL
jgi:CRP-like cAMP-binding protein